MIGIFNCISTTTLLLNVYESSLMTHPQQLIFAPNKCQPHIVSLVLSVHFLVLWFFVSGFLKLVLIGLGLNISGFYNSFDSISNRENDWTARQDFTKNASQYVTKRFEITRTVEHH